MSMKRLSYILLAATFAVGTVACSVNEITPEVAPVGTVRSFVCGFDEDDTKTAITRQGKTVWSEGDKILITNLKEIDTLTVGAEAAGSKFFEFSTTMEDTLYVVYPYNAYKGVSADKKIQVNVLSEQDGTFGSANIACAVAVDRYVKLKNVTTVLNFKVPATTAAPIMAVTLSSSTAMSGSLTVDFVSGEPVVAPTEGTNPGSSVAISVDSGVGDFYASVIPGTYPAGFTMSAATLDLDHAYETISTASEKTLAVNELYNLGSIGANLKPMNGDGSAENPYQITNTAEMLVLSYSVKAGNTLKEKHIKLMNDIEGVNMPVGTYDPTVTPARILPFQGEFDGNGKTITLALNQTNGHVTALFPAIADSAYIHDLKLAGSVISNSPVTASLIGRADTKTPFELRNITNSASITGTSYVGGIIGRIVFTSKFLVENCSNSGEITSNGNRYVGGILGSSYDSANTVNAQLVDCSNTASVTGGASVGGIVGYAYSVVVKNGRNSGAITSTISNGAASLTAANANPITPSTSGANNGTGGIMGYGQSARVESSINTGKIDAVNKGAGIMGVLYWGSVLNSKNEGEVTVANDVAGGIVGWTSTQGEIVNCENTGKITAKGTNAGGIAAQMVVNRASNVIRKCDIVKCVNKGEVSSPGQAVGGIAGHTYSYSNAPNRANIYDSVNEGNVSGGYRAGGIIGWANDNYSWTMSEVLRNKNTGDITAGYQVGGICGYFQGRVTTSRMNVRECENSGTITATRANNASYVGGILGSMNGLTSQGIYIENCLNTGDIVFCSEEFKEVYAGGLAGTTYGYIYRSYNTGQIRHKSREITEEEKPYLGALIADCRKDANLHLFYYTESDLAPFGSGKSTAKNYASVFKVDKNSSLVSLGDGTDCTLFTYNGVDYDNAIDLLNAFNYVFKWAPGPKFSFTDNVNIGNGLDLGNGGQL